MNPKKPVAIILERRSSTRELSVEGRLKRQRMEEASLRTNNVQPPPRPIRRSAMALLLQLTNRLSRVSLGYFKTGYLNSCIVQERVKTIHKVEEAAHQKPAREG